MAGGSMNNDFLVGIQSHPTPACGFPCSAAFTALGCRRLWYHTAPLFSSWAPLSPKSLVRASHITASLGAQKHITCLPSCVSGGDAVWPSHLFPVSVTSFVFIIDLPSLLFQSFHVAAVFDSSLPVQWGFSILSQEVSALVTSMAVSGSFSVHLPSLSFVSPREFPNPFMCLSYWNRRVEFFSVCASTHLSPGSDIPILPCISISFSGGVHIVSQGLFPNKFIYLPYWVVWFFLLPAFPFVYNHLSCTPLICFVSVFGGRRKLLSRWWCWPLVAKSCPRWAVLKTCCRLLVRVGRKGFPPWGSYSPIS